MVTACGDDDRRPSRDGGGFDTAVDAPGRDVMIPDSPFDPDAACATATSEAEVSRRPVDIIWMVDNSTSMEPAVREVTAGLNDFAARIGDSGLDYRVIMLSLRGTDGGGDRFPVCMPAPLAGDGSCGNSDRFCHASVDIRSTQLVETFLGTRGQTDGYREGEARGSVPWLDQLRADSTKTIVVASDDNSRTCTRPCTTEGCGSMCQPSDPRLTEISLEDFPGGGNPFNGNVLGPGILTDTYGTLFEGYTFNGIYGWGSEANPDVTCTYPDDSSPENPGWTYTALVERTGGVRAQVCDQASSAAWDTFFDAVASRVEDTARINCEVPIPTPPDGMMIDADKVNVLLQTEGDATAFRKVENAAACGTFGGWYYDNDDEPTTVILCPASCEMAQEVLRDTGSAGVAVQFGCDTLFI